MVDAGGRLETELQTVVDRLGTRRPEAWDSEDVRRLKGDRLRYNSEGAPLKLTFGSDYPYRDVDALQPVVATGVDAYRALAAGGLSALWGASILPFSDDDLTQWPFTARTLQPYYASALELTGLTGGEDALSAVYPLHAPATALEMSAQAQFISQRAVAHAATLEHEGVYVGRARLAVRQPGRSGWSCTYCGMCLYGCPYGLIYSAADTLSTRLLPSGRFRYLDGTVVRRLTERGDRVIVEGVVRSTGERWALDAARVFLAAGALESTAILLRSLPGGARPVVLRQSDHFLLPLLLRGFRGQVAGERLHTLSQLFIELLDREVSAHGVHLQIYTYSDFYTRMAREKLGPLYPSLAALVERLLSKVVILKGYLHSDDSAGIRAQLAPDGDVLRLEAVASPRAKGAVAAVVAKLRRHRKHLGATPVGLALRIGPVGSGVHVGGSFPMRESPGGLESDLLGRPSGFTRVHAVDATCFPTMPAASPTLTIMANASRIASLAAAEPSP